MTTLTLTPETLTREAFSPFGELIEASDAVRHFTINAGNTERYHDLANIEPGPDGKVIVSIFRGQPRSLPFRVEMMERHPLASQAFIPMSGRPYLVVVAPAGEPPTVRDLRVFLASQAFIPMSGRPYLVVVAPAGEPPTVRELRVFLAGGGQGVNYGPGVWHHPLLALDAVCDFLVVDRSGPGPNCDEVVLEVAGVIPALPG